jgi:hypothetical protein
MDRTAALLVFQSCSPKRPVPTDRPIASPTTRPCSLHAENTHAELDRERRDTLAHPSSRDLRVRSRRGTAHPFIT